VLVHPYHERDRTKLRTYIGTRLLIDDFGLVGASLKDPNEPSRIWKIQAVYAPIPKRSLGGVRTKLIDQYSFITFCNQRDLEVLVGFGTPGRYCQWADQDYAEPGDRNWFGFCADEEDLLDDLHDRETLLRQNYPTGILPRDSIITRRVFTGTNFEEEWDLLWDMDPDTGQCPDTRLQTLSRRWARISRDKVRWPPVY
jgi:hypothetical protein